MTRVRESVVDVVIFSHFFLHDRWMQKNVLKLVNIDGQCTLKEPEMRDVDKT